EKVLIGKIGEAALLEEMAEIAISHAYPKIVVAEKIDALGRPEVRITKIAHGNPLEFTITTAVFPEIVLPDYKTLAKKNGKKGDPVVVTDEDITKTIDQIRRMRGQQEAQKDGKEFDEALPLPEIDDEFVKTLGEFKSVEELKVKLRENILREKEREAEDKRRIAVMDAIAGATKLELPDIIIEQETKRMEDEMTADIARMGLDFEGYLKAINKTREEMYATWKPDAEKRAKIQMLIGKIADVEKLEPDHALVERDAKALRERYPDAPEERVHSYVHMLLTNEQVFKFLLGHAE
ncbi:MAG: trigger factor, partial [Candidatus Nitrotoga sp.]